MKIQIILIVMLFLTIEGCIKKLDDSGTVNAKHGYSGWSDDFDANNSFRVATGYLKDGEFEEASEFFEEAVSYDPGFIEAYNRLAICGKYF